MAKTAHLSPGFIHPVTQTLHIINLGDISGDDEDIGLAHDVSHFLARFGERILHDVSQRNF